MSSNICGNCQNFKPKKGEKFFNCTSARHAGVKYGMQVRADTRFCDAFLPSGNSPEPTHSPRPTLEAKPELEPKSKPLSQSKPAGKQKPKPLSTLEPQPVAKPKREPKPKPAPKPEELPAEDRPRPTGLCVWGRVILIAALVLVIGLPAWGIYSCATNSAPAPAPAPMPTPAPMPANATVKYFDIGENIWATVADRTVMVSSSERITSYSISSGETFNAPSGKVFIFITVTCENTSNTSLLTGPAYFLLTDSTGHLYKDQTYGNYRLSKPYPNASLSPSVTVSGQILWIVPVSASGLQVSYLLDSGGNPPVIARWKLTQ